MILQKSFEYTDLLLKKHYRSWSMLKTVVSQEKSKEWKRWRLKAKVGSIYLALAGHISPHLCVDDLLLSQTLKQNQRLDRTHVFTAFIKHRFISRSCNLPSVCSTIVSNSTSSWACWRYACGSTQSHLLIRGVWSQCFWWWLTNLLFILFIMYNIFQR